MDLYQEKAEPMEMPIQETPEQILAKGSTVDGELQQFERRELFDGKLSIMLPKNFQLMEESVAKIKYPMESRPQVIYTNASGNVNFAFSHQDTQIEGGQVKDCCEQMQAAIARVNPAYVFVGSGGETIGKVQLSWFAFVSFAVDMDIYNFMYIANVEDKILHGVFNCPADLSAEWKIVIKLVVRTIKDLTIGKHPK